MTNLTYKEGTPEIFEDVESGHSIKIDYTHGATELKVGTEFCVGGRRIEYSPTTWGHAVYMPRDDQNISEIIALFGGDVEQYRQDLGKNPNLESKIRTNGLELLSSRTSDSSGLRKMSSKAINATIKAAFGDSLSEKTCAAIDNFVGTEMSEEKLLEAKTEYETAHGTPQTTVLDGAQRAGDCHNNTQGIAFP